MRQFVMTIDFIVMADNEETATKKLAEYLSNPGIQLKERIANQLGMADIREKLRGMEEVKLPQTENKAAQMKQKMVSGNIRSQNACEHCGNNVCTCEWINHDVSCDCPPCEEFQRKFYGM